MEPLRPGDPQQVGGYRLRARLGGGGMGTVYLGTSPGGRSVAVKMVRPDLADDPGFRARFASEVEIAGRVHGFCTAPVVDADPNAAQPWFATLYIPAPSLLEAVREEGPLPVPTARILAAGLAEALIAIHGCDVVHRDVKPSNVLLALDGPRLIDFGIARALDGMSVTLTGPGLLVGSPGYMAPEHAEGREAGPAADIFALGATIGYATTGHAVFGSGEPRAVLYRVINGEPDLAAVPAALRDLLVGCLAKEPTDRPNAAEVLAGLTSAAQGAWQGRVGWLPAAIARLAERKSTAVFTAAVPAGTPAVEEQPGSIAASGSWSHRETVAAGPSDSQRETVAAGPSGPLRETGATPRSGSQLHVVARRSGLPAGPARAALTGETRGAGTIPSRRAPSPGRSDVRRSTPGTRADYGLPPWPKNGAGSASFALGIVGIVLFFGPGALLGALGVLLGLLGIRRAHRGIATNRGVAIAGLITSILAIVISLSVLNVVGRWVECAEQFPGDPAQQADCRSADGS